MKYPFSLLALGALVALGFACSTEVTVSGKSGGPTEHTPCSQAGDGTPCDATIESSCADECGSCEVACIDGSWSVSCGIVDGSCPADLPELGSPCDPLCNRQCPYLYETACGTSESVIAGCNGSDGWQYDTSCVADCRGQSDALGCNALPGCAWAVDCFGDAPDACLEDPLPFGTCLGITCAPGFSCVGLTVNPNDPGAGGCLTAGSASVAYCKPD
jgi:hypothetical protein